MIKSIIATKKFPTLSILSTIFALNVGARADELNALRESSDKTEANKVRYLLARHVNILAGRTEDRKIHASTIVKLEKALRVGNLSVTADKCPVLTEEEFQSVIDFTNPVVESKEEFVAVIKALYPMLSAFKGSDYFFNKVSYDFKDNHPIIAFIFNLVKSNPQHLAAISSIEIIEQPFMRSINIKTPVSTLILNISKI